MTSKDEDPAPGFDTIALHGAYEPDTDVVYGLGKLKLFLYYQINRLFFLCINLYCHH